MILLAGTDDAEKTRLATILREGSLEALVPKTLEEAALAVRDKPLKLVLLCLQTADEPALAQLKLLDEKRAERSLTITLVGDEFPDAFISKAVKLGADLEMRRRKGADYVLAQVEAKSRLVRKPPGESLITGRATTKAVAPGSALENVTASKSWRGSRELLRQAAEAFLTVPARVGVGGGAYSNLVAGCQFLMGNAADSLELRIALAADAKSIKLLATHLFGDEGESMGGELLSELGNILMGTLKTSFSSEAVRFAAGLPEAVPPDRVLSPAATYLVQTTFELQLSDARVVVYLGAKSSAVASLPVGGLREGMVVAGDIFNPKGLMLVRAGTRLSLNMVEKLRGILTPKQHIEVMTA